jgi:Flp pilus assembly protein TadG
VKHSVRGRFFSARTLAGTGGAELVETGLVLTMLLTLMVGIFWLGRAYNIYETITRAAREGARFAVSPSCATCGNAFPSDAEVDAVINGALSASALNPAKVSPAITIQRNQTLDPSAPGANQVAGVIVTFGYPVQLFIPFTSLRSSSFTISTQVQMRQEF